MNTFEVDSGAVARLAEISAGVVLVARWTALLALAWVAHAGRAGRNPRWRVALWRSTALGLAAVSVLAAWPPILTWPLASLDPPPVSAGGHPVTPRPRSTPAAARPESVPPRGHGRRPARGRLWCGSGLAPSPVGRGKPPSPPPPSRSAGRRVRSPGGRAGPGLGPWLLTVWGGGVAALASKLGLAAWRLSRLVGRSSEAPDSIAGETRAIAERVGCGRAVRVRVSAEVTTPCLAGLLRPVLLLPGRPCRDAESSDLRAVLAHELAHVRGPDLAWNNALHLTMLLLWFHPLVWRARSAHASACDAVCDDVAADALGDVAAYGRALARLALRVAGPPRPPAWRWPARPMSVAGSSHSTAASSAPP